jgi:hypothetical protein
MSVPEYVADTWYRSDGGKTPLFKMSSVNRGKWAVRCFSYLTPGGKSSSAELKKGKRMSDDFRVDVYEAVCRSDRPARSQAASCSTQLPFSR